MQKIKRPIIIIDEELCTGCGDCIPSCPEQALELVETPDGLKARLVKDFYCDGLGACLGACPTGALIIEEKEVDPYDDDATIERIKEVAPEMLETHIEHIKEHAHQLELHVTPAPAQETVECGCPAAQTLTWEEEKPVSEEAVKLPAQLRQWPIQLHLVSPNAPYFQNKDLVIVADCVPFAYANFHQDFLKGKAVAIGCPKLDDANAHLAKIAQIIKIGNPRSVTVVNMEVPCCFGLVRIVQQAMQEAGKNIPFETVTISIKGEQLK